MPLTIEADLEATIRKLAQATDRRSIFRRAHRSGGLVMSSVLTLPTSGGSLTDIPSSAVWRLSVEQYHSMIQTGILRAGDPVELLEGVLVPKLTRNHPHRIALTHLRDFLLKLVNHDWHVETQEAITLDTSEPEPDLAVIRGQVDDYPDRHPGPAEIGLVVEVADSSLLQDRGLKKSIYARAGIVEYWIVNLIDQQIEVYSDPTGVVHQPDYRHRLIFTSEQSIPVKLGGVEVGMIVVSQVLPS